MLRRLRNVWRTAHSFIFLAVSHHFVPTSYHFASSSVIAPSCSFSRSCLPFPSFLSVFLKRSLISLLDVYFKVPVGAAVHNTMRSKSLYITERVLRTVVLYSLQTRVPVLVNISTNMFLNVLHFISRLSTSSSHHERCHIFSVRSEPVLL